MNYELGAFRSPKSAVVVGAGLAGLTAVCGLGEAGFDVTVLGARDWVGGRAWTTHNWQERQFADAGAEFIDSNHVRMLRYARRLGVPVEAHEPAWWLTGQLGNTSLRVHQDYQRFWASVREIGTQIRSARKPWQVSQKLRRLDLISLVDWAERLDLLPETRRWLLVYCRNLEAAEPKEVSLLGAAAEERTCQGEVTSAAYHIKGGSQRLAEALAAQMDAKLYLEAVVESVYDGLSHVQVNYSQHGTGYSAEADYAVLAIPNSVLKDISVHPLSHEKRNAIRKTCYGHVVKTLLQFERRFWRKEKPVQPLDHPAVSAIWDITLTQPGKAGILAYWVGG